MIVHPRSWRNAGQPVTAFDIGETLRLIISEIKSDCLSLSGGLDSCLLLYYMLQLGKNVRTFTMTCDEDHPDRGHARLALEWYERLFQVKIESRSFVTQCNGDDLVKAFYRRIRKLTDSIIAGDGVDEYMCGYYSHQGPDPESAYVSHLGNLQEGHLRPLDANSCTTNVYLPYLDGRLVLLMAQIPLSEKVDANERKKVMVELAQGKVPPEIIERRKYGFGTPFAEAAR